VIEAIGMGKLANIYLRKGKFFVSALHKTEAGFWVADAEKTVLESSDESSLRKAVVLALSRSQNGVPTPSRDANIVGPLLAAANVSTWSTFAKLAKCVDVHLGNGELEITPYRNMGGSDGYEPISEKVLKLSEGSEELGKALLAAFEVAE
jgi:hypothetical protein